MNKTELMSLAAKARKNAYAPYSNFYVGAALLAKSGKIYLGCNIENSSFPATICAERVAISKAVSEGERDFEAIAIIGGKSNENGKFAAPCGVCRQVITEFCDESFKIILGNENECKEYSLSEIMPYAFTPKDLA